MSIITTVAEKSRATQEPGDYTRDGLLYCGQCHTPKQCRITVGGRTYTVGCQCTCAEERYQARRQALRQQEQAQRIESLRSRGIQDRALSACRFARAEETPQLARCRRYVQNWDQVQARNLGLLLWGGTGSGKTFAAACVANELISRGVPAMITSFPRILSAGYDRQDILTQVREFPLLVIDDLGVERSSDYALETVYLIVDERYKAKKPLIVTTNLSIETLKNPQNLTYQRIYDRILELCVPIAFPGPDRRRTAARSNREDMAALLQ